MKGETETMNSWKFQKDTINAKRGYRVRKVKNDDSLRILADGDVIIMVARIMTYGELMDELDGNECFHVCEVFHTVKGNKFLYARDEEGDDDYLIKLETEE